ncbi:prolyl aminopeptidase [Mycoplasma sp. NEAQ87857]|uniref:prolyl aminopeptidase n=1 Tax=Mycoplasma sp. NEAQ87857 TaxID=2683967 RepID=UPI00131DBB22|nr:prolyl aminopeptidase [Mycoplasma sp. NEAQ87857]
MKNNKLYKPFKPYLKGFLNVDEIHSLYYEVSGNPNGYPIIFLHGGPGGNVNDKCRRFFDPNFYKIILFDQRGCGKSKPFASLVNNTTNDIVEDVEKLRLHLNLDQVALFGGSWGTTVALLYAIKYPKNVSSMILRGVFLSREEDIDYLYHKGASDFYPDVFEKYQNYVANYKGNNILERYYDLFINETNEAKVAEGLRLFANWEHCLISVKPHKEIKNTPRSINKVKAIALLECYYFVNKAFLKSDNYILENINKIKDIKTFIVHGRQDIDTRPIGAYLLSKHLNNCTLEFVDTAAHTMWESKITDKLVEKCNELKQYLNKLK